MKQLLAFSLIILSIVIFWACSDDSNPVTSTGPRIIDPFAPWDTASGRMDTYIQCLVAKDSNLFAGSADSGVYRSTNNGDSWIKINSGLGNLHAHKFLVKDSNLFVGTSGGLYLSTNNGSTWTLSSTGMGATFIGSLARKDSNLFAGTSNGIFISTNNGANWSSTGLTGIGTITAIAVRANKLFAGTVSNGVYRSTNNGSNWVPISEGLGVAADVYSLAVQDTNILAATNNGLCRTSNDSSWTQVHDGIYYLLASGAEPRALFVYGSNIFLGISTNDGVFLSLNNGTSWISCSAGFKGFYATSFAYNGHYIFAGGGNLGGGGAVWRHAL